MTQHSRYVDHFFKKVCVCHCKNCTQKVDKEMICVCPECPAQKCGMKVKSV